MSTKRVCIELQDVQFGWANQGPALLSIESLSIDCGDSLFIHGASGSGKSTLLNLMTGVLLPRSGDIKVLGHSMSSLRQSRRDQLRVDHMGIIFQQFNLLPYLSVLENLILPCSFSDRRTEMAKLQNHTLLQEAKRLLHALGLNDAALQERKVTALSTGQQQRVAAARALIGAPEIVIADEPTSALDYDAKQDFLQLLFDEVKRLGSTLIFVSHDRSLQQLFDHSIALQDINQVPIP